MHLSKSSWLWKSTYYQYDRRIRLILTTWGRSPTLMYRVLGTLSVREEPCRCMICKRLAQCRAVASQLEIRRCLSYDLAGRLAFPAYGLAAVGCRQSFSAPRAPSLDFAHSRQHTNRRRHHRMACRAAARPPPADRCPVGRAAPDGPAVMTW